MLQVFGAPVVIVSATALDARQSPRLGQFQEARIFRLSLTVGILIVRARRLELRYD